MWALGRGGTDAQAVDRVIGVVLATLLVAPSARAETGGARRRDVPAEAIRLEHLMDQHIYNGQVYEIAVRRRHRTFGDVANHRSPTRRWDRHVPGRPVVPLPGGKRKPADRPLTPDERTFWKGEKAAAMERARPLVAQYHVLANISGVWREKFKLSFAPPESPDDPQSLKLSFGGGIINGEPGLLMRSCIPDSAPDWQKWPVPHRPSVFGPFTFEGVTYHCEDATSRDTYAGATFGMVTAVEPRQTTGSAQTPRNRSPSPLRLTLCHAAAATATSTFHDLGGTFSRFPIHRCPTDSWQTPVTRKVMATPSSR